jgi:hypothetical protein
MASKRKTTARAQRRQAIALAMAAVRLARLADTLASARRGSKRDGRCRRCGKKQTAPGAIAVGSLAVGSFALGATASGAAAFGAVAIKRLAVKRASAGSIEVKRLKVGTLEVGELITPSTREAAAE